MLQNASISTVDKKMEKEWEKKRGETKSNSGTLREVSGMTIHHATYIPLFIVGIGQYFPAGEYRDIQSLFQGSHVSSRNQLIFYRRRR